MASRTKKHFQEIHKGKKLLKQNKFHLFNSFYKNNLTSWNDE